MSNIRVRIAPSPTGFLHIGTARTALFNYLFAKKMGGAFVLRIEDTDLERSGKKYEKDIFEGFKWLGIEADESPEKGGPYEPYRQSERIPVYQKYLEKLLLDGKAFYCFHSEKELEEEKEKLMAQKRPALHMCEYRTLDFSEAKTLAETKSDYIIRFKTPLGRLLEFDDLIRGKVKFDSDLLGDFSIAKRVDVPLYNFAVVIDDYEMQISHIIRGEDHISNTPKQMLLCEALGFPAPHYAHLPLILGSDRSKLSKRHAATSLNEYQKLGYIPEALFNFIALLGWNPGGKREIFSKEELIKEFSLERVQKAGAIFNITKLDWMNGEYIRRKPLNELAKMVKQVFEKSGLLQITNHKSQITNDYIEKIVALEQPRLKKLSEIAERADFFFKEPEYEKGLLRWKDMGDKDILGSLEFSKSILESRIRNQESRGETEKIFLEAIGDRDKGKILWPLRVALSGKNASPGPFEIIEILGVKKSIERIREAEKKVRG